MYVVFIILPIGIAVAYSFTKYSGIGKARFNGIDNYVRLVKDDIFWKSLANTAIIFVVASVLLLVLSFLLALLLNSKLAFADTSKALVFSPAIIAPIIVGIIWVYILDPKIGVINGVLRAVGAGDLAQQWIGGTTLSPYSIAFIYFWQQLGYLTTIFIAGLKMIPEEVMEAVRVDGANAWQRTIHVTIPMMRSTISTVVVLIITGIFKIFEIVQQTTGGGPNHMSGDVGHLQLLDGLPVRRVRLWHVHRHRDLPRVAGNHRNLLPVLQGKGLIGHDVETCKNMVHHSYGGDHRPDGVPAPVDAHDVVQVERRNHVRPVELAQGVELGQLPQCLENAELSGGCISIRSWCAWSPRSSS